MRKIILPFLALFVFIFSGSISAQNVLFDINTLCAKSPSCNPFVNNYLCQTAIIRATHGSPAFYLPATNQTKQIELLAQYGSGGVSYGEGFTLEYPFKANTKYTIKITHSGSPGTPNSYPYLFASLTNSPPRYDDGCGLGYLTGISESYIHQFLVSALPETTSVYDFTPTANFLYLWLRSSPYGVPIDPQGVLIFKIEIVDSSVPPPPPPPTPPPPAHPYTVCDSYHNTHYFCGEDNHGSGGVVSNTHYYSIFTDGTIVLNCELFGRIFNYIETKAQVITLNPGFLASSDHQKYFEAVAIRLTCDYTNHDNNVQGDSVAGIATVDTLGNTIPAQTDGGSTSLRVYPSPSTGIIKIKGDVGSGNSGRGKITVCDQSGRVVYDATYNSLKEVVSVDLGGLSNGMYFVSVYTANNIITRKVILAK